MAKNDNMLAILWMLNSGVKITAKQISEKLEINIRTVYKFGALNCYLSAPNRTVFLLDETSMHVYVPYFLISFGRSIQIIEPQHLKEKMVAIASDLMKYYQL